MKGAILIIIEEIETFKHIYLKTTVEANDFPTLPL